MFKMDFWYPDNKAISSFDCFFCDTDVTYRGNVYDANRKAIGNYFSDNSVEVEKYFRRIGLEIIWY